MAAGMTMRGLVARCVAEHLALAGPAGAEALLRPTGWLKAYRTKRGQDIAFKDSEETKSFGLPSEALNSDQTHALEPHLSDAVIGAVHFTDPLTTPDPQALTESYARLFVARGGKFVAGDALTLAQSGDAWTVTTAEGALQASAAIVALGPWTSDLAKGFGYDFPLGVKRGYHMHYGASDGAFLNRPVLDLERGYVLTPMARGLRLTTGAEFARRDDPPSSAHLDRLEPYGREMFPALGARLDPAPWLGRRPCLPDMIPVIGPAPRHKGLWFDFGHQHLGLTLGPVSGRLLAELMTAETPFVDPRPFRADRF
jgi:D-amino-acid dehydrogenase